MIRTIFALGLLVGVVVWATGRDLPFEPPGVEQRSALADTASRSLAELREVASTWVELPAVPERLDAPSEVDAAEQLDVDDARPEEVEIVEHVAPPPIESEWRGEEAPVEMAAEAQADANLETAPEEVPGLGHFEGNDLDESAEIVRRLLAIHARLTAAR